MRDDKTYYISAKTLKKWHAKLEEVHELRREIDRFVNEGGQRERVLRRTQKVKEAVYDVGGEMKKKLEGAGI